MKLFFFYIYIPWVNPPFYIKLKTETTPTQERQITILRRNMTAPNLILKHFFPPPDININLYILNSS
jgi:hypothetical protein